MANKKKSNAGRKPKKTEDELKDFIPKLEFYAREGYTNSDLAETMGISVATFYNYLEQYPFFQEALEEAKKVTNDKVKGMLFKKAMGFYYEEVEEYQDDTGALLKRKVSRKYSIPDTKAMERFLQNREEGWGDKKEVKIDTDFEFDVVIDGLMMDEEEE